MESIPAPERKQLEEVAKSIDEIDIFKLMRSAVDLLKAYAEFTKKLGEIQLANEESLRILLELGEKAPALFKSLAEKSDPSEFGVIIKTFLELFDLAPKLDNLMALSGEEKIELGENLRRIADTINKMLRKQERTKRRREQNV